MFSANQTYELAGPTLQGGHIRFRHNWSPACPWEYVRIDQKCLTEIVVEIAHTCNDSGACNCAL